MIKTELYFGNDISLFLRNIGNAGDTVTNEQWKVFMEKYITPHFSDGFTVINGYGQWKNADGTITHENSKILILLHGNSVSENNKIDEIVYKYKYLFNQESVMRIDYEVNVTF